MTMELRHLLYFTTAVEEGSNGNAAKKLNIALKNFAENIGENNLDMLRDKIIEQLNEDPIIEVEYLELADAQTMELLSNPNQSNEKVVCVAANVEEVRLIDNLIIS